MSVRFVRQDDSHLQFSFWPDPPKRIYPEEMFPLDDVEIVPSYSLDSMASYSLPSTPESQRKDLTSSFVIVDHESCKESPLKSVERTKKKNSEKKEDKNEQKVVTDGGTNSDEGSKIVDPVEQDASNGGMNFVSSLMTSGYDWCQKWFSSK